MSTTARHPRIPLLDLTAQLGDIEDEILDALLPLLRDGKFVGGEPVARFEAAFAARHGVAHAVTVKSGTAAIQLALEAMGLGPKDEVLVPAFTFIATAASVVRAGARPVFVDVDPDTACIDPARLAEAVTPRTRALLPVHLYGHPAPMTEIIEIAARHGLRVLEDCAQSHLAELGGRVTGTLGQAGAFSFYPTKNLGAAGDAGCVISADGALAERVRTLANHGRLDRYRHGMLGWNERLDALQAAVLAVKLRHLDDWTASRRAAAGRYGSLLQGIAPWGEPLRLPVERPAAKAVYHLYVVRHSRRDAIAERLAAEGIDTATHYPLPLHRQPAFEAMGLGGGAFPVSDAWAASALSLPFFPEITESQQERVAEALRAI